MDELRKLREENLRLRAENQTLRALNRSRSALKNWVSRHLSNFFVGRGLSSAMQRLFVELPGPVSKETMDDVSSHVIWRVTRIGFFAILIGLMPLMVMALQTLILNIQNDKLEVQNQLILNQNRRLDQQIHLEEANRRSSFVFLMGNVLDQIDEELQDGYDRRLSDELIGRIVSLTQALRPYRYLENDELTLRPLSPERGQLLFALINSRLDRRTYDKIFGRANFSYADLREANFTDAYLRGANLAHSSFSNANFTRANLELVDFSNAYLENSLFINTYMPGVDLQYANLRNSQFENVTMHDANLAHSDLREIALSGNFARCNLEGIQLRDAELNDVVLDNAFFDSPDWLNSLQDANVRGFFTIEDNYIVQPEVKPVNAYRSDTIYILHPRKDQATPVMSDCEKRIVELLYSSPRIRKLDHKFQEEGVELLVLQAPRPDNKSKEVRRDSIYTFHLTTRITDSLTTHLQVGFDLATGQLFEIPFQPGKSPVMMSFDQSLLQRVPLECLTGPAPKGKRQ